MTNTKGKNNGHVRKNGGTKGVERGIRTMATSGQANLPLSKAYQKEQLGILEFFDDRLLGPILDFNLNGAVLLALC